MVFTCLVVVSVFAYSTFLGVPASVTSDGITYNGYVCRQITRADGTVEPAECSHNVLYLSGANLTRDLLTTNGDGSLLNNISLCNATAGCTAPVAAASETFNYFTGCGLSSATDATISNLASQGANWTVYKTFVVTGCSNQLTNSTRLSNDATLFAGNNFTLATLNANDQITINWTISIT